MGGRTGIFVWVLLFFVFLRGRVLGGRGGEFWL